MEHKKYNAINQPVRKKDSMQLLLGKPVYVEDIAPKDALAVSYTHLDVYKRQLASGAVWTVF